MSWLWTLAFFLKEERNLLSSIDAAPFSWRSLLQMRPRLPRVTVLLVALCFVLVAIPVFSLPSGLPSGLVGSWDGNSTALDDTGVNNGTFGGTYVAGHNGQQAFDISGTGGATFMYAGTTGLPTGSSVRTLSLWVNVPSFTAEDTYFAWYGAGATNAAFGVGQYNGRWIFTQDGANFQSSTTFSLNTWYYLSVEETGVNTQAMYVNDVLVGTGALTVNTGSGGQLTLGGIGAMGPANPMNAYVQDVRIYNLALTTAQLSSDMNAVVPEPRALLILPGLVLVVLLLRPRRAFAC